MNSSAALKPVYKLGRVPFTVTNCDNQFVSDLDKLIPHCDEPNLNPDDVYDARMGCIRDLRELINHMLKQHRSCIWIDASCVVSPEGRKVLISGKSDSGKSTTAMALAFGRGWKVLAEDVTLIDPATDQILNFPSPFSLKIGTVELITEVANIVPGPIILDEWIPMGSHSFGRNCKTPFDLVVHFEENRTGNPLTSEAISVSDYVRRILTLSNLVRVPGATDKFIEYVSEGRGCHLIKAGSLTDRLDKIAELAAAH